MDTRFVLQLTDAAAFVACYEKKQRDWVRVSIAERAGGFSHLPRESSDLIPLGESVGTWLRGEFPEGITCRLVIPASWCFIHSVECAIGRNRGQAALYEFEQFVPVDLDTLTCVVQRVDDDRDLVVGALTEPLNGLLTELEKSGVFVEAIYVDALIASGCDMEERETGGSGVVLLDAGRMTLAGATKTTDAPVAIRSVVMPLKSEETNGQQIVTAINTLPVSSPLPKWHVFDFGSGDENGKVWDALVASGFEATRTSRDESVQRLLDTAANHGHQADLRRDGLSFAGRWAPVRRRLTMVVGTLLVLLMVIGFKFRLDNMATNRGIASLVPMRTEIYQQAYPGQAPPPEAALRLRSERIKLEGLTDRGNKNTDVHAGNGLQLFEMMDDILTQLPEDLKLSISEILLDERTVNFTGRTTSHGKAGELVHALNQIPTISAEPPNTKLRKDHTVDFRINARVQRITTND